jgi:glutathione S-transferase
MITLLTYAPAFDTPAASPFCVKAMMLLNLAGVAWQSEVMSDPRKMPKQKLPAIRVDNQLIADSENIRTYLEANGADFDASLTNAERAQSRAIIRMVEEHLYFHCMLDRWADDAVWPTVKAVYFSAMPALPRKFVPNMLRKALLKGMMVQGLARFTSEERLERIDLDLTAIATLVGDGFLFRDTPTAADASAGAFMDGALKTPVETLLTKRIKNDAILMAYADRCNAAMIKA